MILTATQVTMLTITDAPGLDRIKVITEDFKPGQGQLTVICYGRAWTAYWGAMGGDVSRFVMAMNAGYIAENLLRGMQAGLKKDRKHEEAYLLRIVQAVQEGIRVNLRRELHGVDAC